VTIKWVGVPKDARKPLRKAIREMCGSEFLVCSDKGRDQEARKSIRDSLWAFNAEFISYHARGDLDHDAIKALKETQSKLCESANELVFSMLKSFRAFWRAAVAADGHAHFLNTYDGNEEEVTVKPDVLDRMVVASDAEVARTFYVYRTN
jgi:hypothetical protein